MSNVVSIFLYMSTVAFLKVFILGSGENVDGLQQFDTSRVGLVDIGHPTEAQVELKFAGRFEAPWAEEQNPDPCPQTNT